MNRCRRCNRPLKNGRQIGRTCQRLEREEKRSEAIELAIVAWSEKQREDAKELIKAGKLKPLDRPGMYRITSRDGQRTYFTSALSCPCAARGLCLHRCAAAIADAFIAFGETFKAVA